MLTAMEPNPQLSAVTVSATARSGHPTDWSLTAYATCDSSTVAPLRVVATVRSTSTAEADCPNGTLLVGTGFRLEGSVDRTYVDEVSFDAGLRKLRVHARGDVDPTSLTALGVCASQTGPAGVRVGVDAGADGTWPRTAVTGPPGPDVHVYGVGAIVTGQGEVFLSALASGPDLRLAVAEAVRASRLPGAPATDRVGVTAASGDDGATLTVAGVLLAAFH
ncbi:hypothetical protein ACIA5A_26515 [Micromonospora sp. NPDC051300]|uniref:hypothetical protein n=1 Tax=Micromonospora sp. NPDC051300 TaxID=3364286 RepID=UPI0037983D49